MHVHKGEEPSATTAELTVTACRYPRKQKVCESGNRLHFDLLVNPLWFTSQRAEIKRPEEIFKHRPPTGTGKQETR